MKNLTNLFQTFYNFMTTPKLELLIMSPMHNELNS